ncbi:MAG TPA: hypothetical protein VFM37_13900 [Pseudonocardiaceae bacterium]|nr:hypothetical protein [Pseudonocardiaceae bacterium]
MNTASSVNRLNQFDDVDLRTGTSGVPFQRGADPNRVTPDQVQRARMVVARNAADNDDCRRLLDMLGLLEGPDGLPPVCR